MIKDKSIYIKNVYYMLSYVFQNLNQTNYEHISGESFDNIYDLLTEILFRGVSQQIKQGLYREYVEIADNIPTIRGKLEISNTIKNKITKKPLIYCEYDELTENNIYNQIIKSTMLHLLAKADVDNSRKACLKQALLYFSGIDVIETSRIKWNSLHYQSSNRTYQMLINICYFILKNQILSDEKGNKAVMNFADDNMARLYEKFILEYYRRHYPKLKPTPKHIDWATDEENLEFLPEMITDIHLTDGKKILIIDAKYYGKSMREHFGKHTFHSNNFYQIQSYVTNADRYHTGNVAGMLLYAKTDETITPDRDFFKNVDNYYAFKTLDLGTSFDEIAIQLNAIVDGYFEI